jgi:hypothetical protein
MIIEKGVEENSMYKITVAEGDGSASALDIVGQLSKYN